MSAFEKFVGLMVFIVFNVIIIKMIATHLKLAFQSKYEDDVEREVRRRVHDALMNMKLSIHTEVVEDTLGHDA